MFSNLHILLASKSPRRHQLLGDLGISFEVVEQNFEEVFPGDMDKHQVPEFLALGKAKSIERQPKDKEIILTSDTVVLLNNKIYGKPKNREQAVQFLSELSGQAHEVITAICLMSQNKTVLLSDTSKVYFDELSLEEIHYYIDKYQPYDKAGAYAIQEWIGHAKIKKIDGSYASIMGLPTNKLYNALKAF